MIGYQKTKTSAVDWIGDIPKHWDIRRLKRSTKLITEKASKRDNPIALENIESWTGRLIKTETEFEGDGIAFNAGDILFGKLRPYLAKAYLTDLTGEAVGDLLVLRPEKDTNSKFTQYQILNREFISIVNSSTFGSKMPRTSWDFMGNMLVTAPPIDEQEKIVNFLDRETSKIDELIQKQERLVELLNEKRLEVIRHAITKGIDPNVRLKESGIQWIGKVPEVWAVKQLKWITPIKRGASPRPIDDPIYFDDENGEYAWVRISDVTSSNIYLEQTEQKLSALGASLSVKLEPGKLFLSIAGSVGKPCITKIKACIHDGFVYFPKFNGNNMWLYYMFETKLPFGGLGKMGTQLNLNTDTIGSIYVPMPPENEIERIISHIEEKFAKFNMLISKSIKSIELLKEHRSSLISAAVTGKIDVREVA